jgi:ubiquinone/menaquinone biosynthesis C-methylase UbiE
MANGSRRVDYDAIAALYDSQPYRVRAVDREFLQFAEQRASTVRLSALDVGCGTGNQLVANRSAAPQANLVGLDRSLGMLRQARRKTPDIIWVRGDAAAMPFPDRSFDFISSQFAFHHIEGKASMLHETFRVLRPAGRFVLRNMCPQQSVDWLYYEYFPEAQIVDLQDFWPPEAITAVMEGAGFIAVTAEYEHLHFEQDLSAWLETVRRRDTCSQLQAIPDAAYEAGLGRLARELADADGQRARADHLCLITIRGEKPTDAF